MQRLEVSGALRHTQGDSGGICNTLRNDSMCDSKQKSSYKHGYVVRRQRVKEATECQRVQKQQSAAMSMLMEARLRY
jgi:hypothetical protein